MLKALQAAHARDSACQSEHRRLAEVIAENSQMAV